MQAYFFVFLSVISMPSASWSSSGTSTFAPCQDQKPLTISSRILDNRDLPFLERSGPADVLFANALAMNVRYEPIQSLKTQIENTLELKEPLKIFTGWNSSGEAHVTTITPVEFDTKFVRNSKPIVSPARMNEIARDLKIQESDLEILGLGSGRAIVNGKTEETFFVIVRSENLLRIRRAIHAEFVRNGGDAAAWNPEHFFPHITIAYTSRDLHENDGVIKDAAHSLDRRFQIAIESE